MEKRLKNEIRNLQNILNNDVENNNLNDESALKLGNKIDKLINDYYSLSIPKKEFPIKSEMKEFYDASYRELKRITIENNRFPELEEWNKYAKENNLLSSESMKYISMMEWKYLKLKIKRQINKKY